MMNDQQGQYPQWSPQPLYNQPPPQQYDQLPHHQYNQQWQQPFLQSQPNTYYPPQQWQQSPMMPPPQVPPQKPKSRARLWLIIVILVLTLIVIAAIALQAGNGSQPTATPNSPSSIEQQMLALAQAQALGTDLTSTYDSNTESLVITEKISGALSNDTLVSNMHVECFDIQKALWTNSIRIYLSNVEVDLYGGDLVDRYGQPITSPIGICKLSSKTEGAFVWENLDGDMAWEDYDYAWHISFGN